MKKKLYIPPRLVDLSLESLTGIGATSCNTGTNFGDPSCSPTGYGYTSGCGAGAGASTWCSDGYNPSQAHTYCNPGLSANGSCEQGTTAGLCNTGNTATPACGVGSGGTSFCTAGNLQSAIS
ncbi:MAG: hypothetical protein HQK56_15800 [Deltaproteobacteria bacterium]|nr:hypothetical protein [Deltaproteobacteria bacterium]